MLFLNSAVYAGYKADVGYLELQTELGTCMPDGNDIIATQCEALQSGNWMPNPTDPQFSGKTINDKSGANGSYSNHATNAGYFFYGNNSSLSPGILVIDSYEAGHWMGSGFLNTGMTDIWGNPVQPIYDYSGYPWVMASPSRIANHSWVGNVSPLSIASDILRRLDWVIETDEFIQMVANCSASSPLLGNSFNGVTVGRTSGESGTGSVFVDDDYNSGRTKPDIVAPLSYLSTSTPLLSSAAALLIETGHNNPDLSTDPSATYTLNRNLELIYNAERSEVIKAALMAGAERVTQNGSEPNVLDYRKPACRATNGLDIRYGSGQLNIYHSFHILAAGEQDSQEDNPSGQGIIGWQGFDFDPSFGGNEGSNTQGSYYFIAEEGRRRLYVALVWNIDIKGGNAWNDFDNTATLFDLDLFLYDITYTGEPLLISSSTSCIDNTENLWVSLANNHHYLLQVKAGTGQEEFNWDYALAWRIETSDDTDGDQMPDDWEVQYILDFQDPYDAAEDPDQDGLLNMDEYTHGTSPDNPDSDNDDYNDGTEVGYETDPLNPSSYPPHQLPVLNIKVYFLAVIGLMIIGQILPVRILTIS